SRLYIKLTRYRKLLFPAHQLIPRREGLQADLRADHASLSRRSAGCECAARVGRVLVSFGISFLAKHRSFPRKRESTPQAFGNALFTDWIPAFAGMTAAWSARFSEMTSRSPAQAV